MRPTTMKYVVAFGLTAAALAMAATPTFAQKRMQPRAGTVETTNSGPFASGEGYVDSGAAGYKGMRSDAGCWVETDLGRGFGYWGSCGDQGKALGAATGQFRTRNQPIPPR